MTVTTGKICKIEIGDFVLERSCETPGKVSVHRRSTGDSFSLPANDSDRENFIEAYRRICNEEIEYRKKTVE